MSPELEQIIFALAQKAFPKDEDLRTFQLAKRQRAKTPLQRQSFPPKDPFAPDEPDFVAVIEAIPVPEIAATDISAADFFDYLRVKVHDWHPESEPGKKGVSVVIQGPVTDVTLDYKVRNTHLGKVLPEVAKLTMMDVHITSDGIIICSPSVTPTLTEKAQPKLLKSYLSSERE